jgi:hypothetical protein
MYTLRCIFLHWILFFYKTGLCLQVPDQGKIIAPNGRKFSRHTEHQKDWLFVDLEPLLFYNRVSFATLIGQKPSYRHKEITTILVLTTKLVFI